MSDQVIKIISQLGTVDQSGDPFVEKVLTERTSILELTNDELFRVGDTLRGAILRADAWRQFRQFRGDIKKIGEKYLIAYEFIEKAQANGFKMERR